MASKCPMIRAAEIAREAKKMQLEAAKEHLKTLQEEYKLLVQAVKDEKERFKSGKATTQRFYKDNAANRKLGRVGKPIPSRKGQKKVESKAVVVAEVPKAVAKAAEPEDDSNESNASVSSGDGGSDSDSSDNEF